MVFTITQGRSSLLEEFWGGGILTLYSSLKDSLKFEFAVFLVLALAECFASIQGRKFGTH